MPTNRYPGPIVVFISIVLPCQLASAAVAIALDPTASPVASSNIVVDFGLVPRGGEAGVSLRVTNLDRTPADLLLMIRGKAITATWSQSGKPLTFLRVGSHATAVLQLHINGALEPSAVRPARVNILSGDQQVALIVLSYKLADPVIQMKFDTPALDSGLGKYPSSPYHVSSGPAPWGYTLNGKPSFTVSGTCLENAPRSCGSWVDCRSVRADETNVAYEFVIQGAEPKFGKYSASTCGASGHLTVSYSLKKTEPKLIVLEASKLPGRQPH